MIPELGGDGSWGVPLILRKTKTPFKVFSACTKDAPPELIYFLTLTPPLGADLSNEILGLPLEGVWWSVALRQYSPGQLIPKSRALCGDVTRRKNAAQPL